MVQRLNASPPSPIPTHNVKLSLSGQRRPYPLLWRSNMGRKLYVGNLTYTVTASELEQLFGQYGTVESAQVIADRNTGQSKGFAFVEMKTEQEAQAAIAGLSGKEMNGRALTVNEAKPREAGGGRSSGGRGGSGRGRW